MENACKLSRPTRLGSSDFARHYFRNRGFFLFLEVLRCFSSLRWHLLRDDTAYTISGFPIGKSPDQSLFSSSPRLIAANRVLHRRLSPRHPPYALSSLTKLFNFPKQGGYHPPDSENLQEGLELKRWILVRKLQCFGRYLEYAIVKEHSPSFRRRNFSKFLRAHSWSQSGSNRRPPGCKPGALPTELWPQFSLHEPCFAEAIMWACLESNQGPYPYQGYALAN